LGFVRFGPSSTTGEENVMDETIKKLTQPFDRALVKERIGPGGKVLSYVAIGEYIARLNDAFGYKWDYEITDLRFLEEEVIVQVRITTPGGMVKAAIGGAAITKRRDNGKPVSIAHDLMSAEATALKRAARLLGIGAALYVDDDEVGDAPEQQTERAPEPRNDSPRITSAQLSKLRSLVTDWNSYRAEVRERHGVNLEFATRRLASELIDELVRANGAQPRNNNGHANSGHRGNGYQPGGWRRA